MNVQFSVLGDRFPVFEEAELDTRSSTEQPSHPLKKDKKCQSQSRLAIDELKSSLSQNTSHSIVVIRPTKQRLDRRSESFADFCLMTQRIEEIHNWFSFTSNHFMKDTQVANLNAFWSCFAGRRLKYHE
jgi:hypothetical protein